MVRTGVDGFFASVDRVHGDDESGLEWISEGGNLILSLHRVQAEFLWVWCGCMEESGFRADMSVGSVNRNHSGNVEAH